MGYVIFAGVAGLIIVVILAARLSNKRRTEAWQRVAERLGLTFLGKNNDILTRFGHLRMLSRGSSRRCTNAILGSAEGIEIIVADYHYSTGSGKSRNSHNQTICILRNPALALPHCFLRPEVRFFDFLGAMFGGQDIDFDDDPEFSESYVLQGDDESAVRGLFDSNSRAWFVSRRGENLHFEITGDTLLFHTIGRLKPDETRDLMQKALEVMKLLAHRGRTA